MLSEIEEINQWKQSDIEVTDPPIVDKCGLKKRIKQQHVEIGCYVVESSEEVLREGLINGADGKGRGLTGTIRVEGTEE